MTLGGGLSLGLAAAGAAGKAYNYFSVQKDREKSQALLDKLSNMPLADYTADPALMQYYSRNLSMATNPQGLTGGEKAAYRSNVATDINTQFSNANRMSGGGLGKYISSALTPSVVSGENALVGQDATLRRNQENVAMGRLGTTVSALQNLKNMNVQMQNQRLLMAQQAAAQSVLQNKGFQQQDIEGLSSDLLGAGLMMGMGGGSLPGGFSKLFSGSKKTAANPYMDSSSTIGDVSPDLMNYVSSIG